MIIQTTAYPRAALIGNPSDGYNGKTVAFTFTNFAARVTLWQSPEITIMPSVRDHSEFRDIEHLVRDVNLFGYYGGIRLLKAAVKQFYVYCCETGIQLEKKNFTIRYSSDIPHLVGLAGSSAIITACFRAIMAFFGVTIPKPVLANLILSVETDELGIAAGLQDRVAQVYQGLVFMDFNKDRMASTGSGVYEYLDESLLPPLYIAFRNDLSEGSEIVHSMLREQFIRKEPKVLEAVSSWVRLTDELREALSRGHQDRLTGLMNENFDIRRRICRISEENQAMVDAARSAGASAKFTGSGGAIIGTCSPDSGLDVLRSTLEPLGITVIQPTIAPRVQN